MWLVEQALQRLIGVTPAFMRPPYGLYNDLVRSVSAQRGQKLVIWNFDSQDSLNATAQQSEANYDTFFANHPSTAIALNHETYCELPRLRRDGLSVLTSLFSDSTVFQVLPYALNVLKGKGYQLVTLAECLGQNAYLSVGQPQSVIA
jgi:peptidoglycan/xylan/chitin deacetylase (PgdA/CDA1 family)